MKTITNINGTLSRISAIIILTLAFTAISYAGDIVEDELVVEAWMTTPFESLGETELALENWMITPFEISALEGDLALETWMAIPFESSVIEAELALESWMTTPFEIEVCLLSCCK